MPPDIQDRMISAHRRRNHNTLEYQVSGKPYREEYPELAVDPTRTRNDLLRIRNGGLQTMIAFDDTRWPDLSYLQPVADVTQDLVNCVMGIYEVNGVVRDPNIVLLLLKQARAMWPKAKLAVHFTDLMAGESHGLVDFRRAVAEAGLNMLFFQASGWLYSTKEVADRGADFTRRNGGPEMHGGQTLSDGVVQFEIYTSKTFREEMTEEENVQKCDDIRRQVPGKPDGAKPWISVPFTGFMDGGSE
jgi:hypothetical protein